MRTFDFRVFVTLDDPAIELVGGPQAVFDQITERVFEAFEGDVTPAMIGGEVILECTVRDASLEKAYRRVLLELSPVLGELKEDRAALPSLLQRVRFEATAQDLVYA